MQAGKKGGGVEVDVAGRKILGFTSNLEDEETIRKIVKILYEDELTVDRASRILADAQKLLPFLGKLVID